MSTELQKTNDQTSVSVSALNESLEQFKAFFYLAKGKRDTQIKLYHDNKSFSRQNVIDLNEKIENKLLNYSVSNKLTSISVNLSKNNIKSFGNWQEFLNETWSTSEKTETLTIDWDFEMVLPNRIHSIPQTHSLKVRLGNKLKPNEILHLMMGGGDEFDFEQSQAQMVAKVDFINNNIATELLAIVNDWYNALPDIDNKDDLNKFLSKYNTKLRMAMETLIVATGLALFYPIGRYLIFLTETKDLLKTVFLLLNGLFLSYTIFSKVSAFYGNKFDSKVNKLSDYPYFNFTTGDANELEKVVKKNKGLRKEIYMKLFITILYAIIIFVASFLFNCFVTLF